MKLSVRVCVCSCRFEACVFICVNIEACILLRLNMCVWFKGVSI